MARKRCPKSTRKYHGNCVPVIVEDLEKKKHLTFTNDTEEVFFLKDKVQGSEDYDSFFVDYDANGFKEVWGMHGSVPTLEKRAWRIK